MEVITIIKSHHFTKMTNLLLSSVRLAFLVSLSYETFLYNSKQIGKVSQ